MNVSSRSKYQRREKKFIPEDEKDEKYYERRRRNNEAAKKSRDARRIREDFIELKLKILESENEILQRRIMLLCQEVDSLNAFILEIQRQRPEIFNRSFWPDINSMQTTSFHQLQLCCIRNLNEIVATNPTVTGTASDTLSSTTSGVTAWNTLISRLSSVSQIPRQSLI